MTGASGLSIRVGRADAVNDATMAFYARQQEIVLQQMNRKQHCLYNGNTVGGGTSGTISCM